MKWALILAFIASPVFAEEESKELVLPDFSDVQHLANEKKEAPYQEECHSKTGKVLTKDDPGFTDCRVEAQTQSKSEGSRIGVTRSIKIKTGK